MTEDKMLGWHHRLNRHEFKQALGDGPLRMLSNNEMMLLNCDALEDS